MFDLHLMGSHNMPPVTSPGSTRMVGCHCAGRDRPAEALTLAVKHGCHENLGGGGGFKYFLFSPLFGEDPQFD